MSNKFVKRRNYEGAFRPITRWRRSKVSREYRAYRAMDSIGVPCPGGLELSVTRNAMGWITDSELAMDKIEDARDLRFICLLDEYKAIINDPKFRQAVIQEVAKWVRVMHDNHFYHLNLNFRNILVRTEPLFPIQVYFIDAASAKINPTFNVSHYLKKDIAFLYKDARAWFTAKEMMQFAHCYFDCKKLTAEQHQFVVELITYARHKWSRSSRVDD